MYAILMIMNHQEEVHAHVHMHVRHIIKFY